MVSKSGCQETELGRARMVALLGRIWSEKLFAVEVYQVIGGIRDPHFTLPRNFRREFSEGFAIQKSRHVDDISRAFFAKTLQLNEPELRDRSETVNCLN